jgi:DNA transformation protein
MANSDFIRFISDQMSVIGHLRIRAMFGGHGIYKGDRMFAIVVDDRLFFKVDDVSRGDFELAGSSPFTYKSKGRSVTLQYYEAPSDVFDNREGMKVWAEKALEAATRAQKKPGGKPKQKGVPR